LALPAGRQARQGDLRAKDPELGRYLEVGAVRAVRYRFPAASRRSDDFFCGRFMETYSEGVLIEGENPLDYRLDLWVYVAPPLPEGEPLLPRVPLDRKAERAADLSDPKDPGLRQILTRIKRPFARRL